jgi:uncharacterized protein YceK
MKGTQRALLAAAMLIPLSGCGTVLNLASGNPDNYGGVQRDLNFGKDATDKGGFWTGPGRPETGGGSAEDTWGAGALLALYGADVGLSFLGDTLTLPLAAYLRHRHEATLTNSTCTGN